MVRKQIYTAKKKRWHQKRYQNRLSKGLCPICGGKRTGEWVICTTCRAKNVARTRAMAPEALRETKRKSINKYRARCRKQGICYACGGYIGLGRYKRCEACREKDRLAHAERYAEVAVKSRE